MSNTPDSQINNTHTSSQGTSAQNSIEKNGKVDTAEVERILADKELTAKILREQRGQNMQESNTANAALASAYKSAINRQAVLAVAFVLVYFILGVFIISPFLQLLMRMVFDLFDPGWMAGVSANVDETRFYIMYHEMIKAINIVVYTAAGFLYIYWICRIIAERKNLRGRIPQYLVVLLPFIIFLMFDIGIILVTIIRGPNEYDLTGHPYMQESIFSYILYPISYFFCGMMLYHDKWKKVLLYALVFTALPVNFLAYLTKLGVPFPYYLKYSVLAVFHNANHYGYYLAFVVMVSAMLFVYEKQIALKIICFVSVCLGSLMLVINNTLGAYLATGVVLTFFLGYTVAQNHREIKAGERARYKGIKGFFKAITESGTWQGALFVLVFYVAFTLVLNTQYHTVVESFLKLFTDTGDIVKDPMGADHAGSKRWLLWKNTVKHIPEHPLTGFGVEGLLNTYQVGTPHNEILQYAAFFGIPVTVLYLAACIITFVRVWMKRKKLHPATMICFFVAVGYLVNSLFGVAIYYTTPFMFIFLGMAYAECVKE